jgi:iron(III) transport system permease protein
MATFALCVAFFVISVVLPIGQLLLGSFFQFFGFYQWDMLTLEHYRSVLSNSEVWRAFRNTDGSRQHRRLHLDAYPMGAAGR